MGQVVGLSGVERGGRHLLESNCGNFLGPPTASGIYGLARFSLHFFFPSNFGARARDRGELDKACSGTTDAGWNL